MTFDMHKAREDLEMHENAIEEAQPCMCGHCHECGFDPAEMKAPLDEIERLRDLVSGEPAWKVTRDRILGVQYAIELMEQPGGNDRKKEGYRGVLRGMLEEAGER